MLKKMLSLGHPPGALPPEAVFASAWSVLKRAWLKCLHGEIECVEKGPHS